MSKQATRTARSIALFLALTLVASCGTLPRSGPTKRDIFEGSVMNGGDAFIVDVNRQVTAATATAPGVGFGGDFAQAGVLGADTILPGDTLGLIIYENVDNGLLTNAGASASLLDEVQVDSAGMIFIPYAGRLRAAGNTPEALRQLITRRLDEQTPDPQVIVRRLAGDGATVNVVGGTTTQGVFPIERPTRTLTGMIAAAGGVSISPEVALVNVRRGDATGTAYLSDLFKYPGMDIALRNGDTIFVEEDKRTFTVLGATGAQTQLEFDTEVITAIEALAQVGGLNPLRANPTGVFVFRDESAAIASAVTGQPDLVGTQRMVYVLDLTEPNGLFDARDFVIRDGDTVYVTEAPIVAWNRSVAAIFGSLGQLTGAANTVGGIGG